MVETVGYTGFYRLRSKIDQHCHTHRQRRLLYHEQEVVDHLNSMPEESRYIRGMQAG